MAGWSDTEELAILLHYFSGGAAIAKSTYHIALCITTPSDTAIGNEPTYTGYARVAYTAANGWTDNGLDDPTGITNDIAIQYTECPAGTPAETVRWFAIMSAVTGGNLLFWGDIVNPAAGLALVEGLIPQFEAGALVLRLGG